MSDEEDSWMNKSEARAFAEGLVVRNKKLFLRVSDAADSELRCIEYGCFGDAYNGRIEGVALCPKTHLYAKIDGEWIRVCSAFGQILNYLEVPVCRRSKN